MRITDEALEAAAILADRRYIQDRHLPDKAIDLIDEAASRMRIRTMTAPPRYASSRRRSRRSAPTRKRRSRRRSSRKAASLRDKERKLSQKKRELEDQWRDSAEAEQRPDRRERDRGRRLDVDGHPRLQAHRGGVGAASPHGGGAAQAAHRPARGDRLHRSRSAAPVRGSRTRSGRPARSSSSARRPSEDRAGAHARRVPVRRRGRDDQARHVGVHGEALRVPARRLASGLHRLRRGRPAHRGRASQAVLGRRPRRDREGAPGRVQHPPADPRGRSSDRRPGAQGRLPEHDP